MYRYRRNSGATRDATVKVFKHLSKIGELIEVRGYQHIDKHGTLMHAIMFKGTLGSIRVNGFCFGYGGTGPRGLRDALVRMGVPQGVANRVSFNIPQRDTPGMDWRLVRGDEDLPLFAWQVSQAA